MAKYKKLWFEITYFTRKGRRKVKQVKAKSLLDAVYKLKDKLGEKWHSLVNAKRIKK